MIFGICKIEIIMILFSRIFIFFIIYEYALSRFIQTGINTH